jgi:hypothetical protein
VLPNDYLMLVGAHAESRPLGKGGIAMERQKPGQQMHWRGVGLRGIILLPLVIGALLGVTQALFLLCVLMFLLLPL